MPLRDDLKTYIPLSIFQTLADSKGDIVTADRWNELFNLLITQGDDTTANLKNTLDMLYETVLSDTDGAPHVFIDDPEFAATTVKAALLELAVRIATNAGNITSNDTDIANGVSALNTHKASADHDGRYYTEAEIDAFEAAMQVLVNQNAASAVSLQNQINALDDIYSTDAERAAAIAATINAFELADDDLEALINGKANASDVYTKAEIDAMTLGSYKLDYNQKYHVLPGDASSFLIDVPGFNSTNDVVMVHRGGRIMTEGVEFQISVDDLSIESLEGNWPSGTEFDYWVIKNIRVVTPGDFIDGGIIQTGSITRDKLAAAVLAELDTLRTDVDQNTADIITLDGIKAELTNGSGTITTTGWVASATNYALELVLSVPGVLATDFVDVAIEVNGHTVAQDAELSGTVVEGLDTLTFYANTAPASAINFDWKVVR